MTRPGTNPYPIDTVEFPSESAQTSGAFFAEVFGWSTTGYGSDYVDVNAGAVTLGFQSDDTEKPSAPLVVIRVKDLRAARSAIEAAGGAVTVEPFDFPGGSRMHFREPGGAELAVWTPSDP